MDQPRPCGCKGCRTCLLCESSFGISSKNITLSKDKSYVYCPICNKAWPGWDLNEYQKHPNHTGEPIDYPGVYIDLEFLTQKDEIDLMKGIDEMSWDLSQSGRRKQNFGPKCNFKKNKLKVGEFCGFPAFSKFVQEKLAEVPLLKGFHTIEQCSLEYTPERGASIDPHIDDCWIWGERIISVNLLADSVLTMTYNEKNNYYNLDAVKKYPAVLGLDNKINNSGDSYSVKPYENDKDYPIVRIPMPKRSLLVLYNSARYDWEHQILREDIVERRICLAYREFTPPYLPHGAKHNKGEEILDRATQFWNHLK